jgi:mono/diheme cytochrome c family protein
MLVAFSLDGAAEMPPSLDPMIPEPIEAQFAVDPQLAGIGGQIYGLCAHCHGPAVVSSGMAPDLRASLLVTSEELFAGVVRDGARAVGGMPAYADMPDGWLLALRHYIRQQAELALAGEAGNAGPSSR